MPELLCLSFIGQSAPRTAGRAPDKRLPRGHQTIRSKSYGKEGQLPNEGPLQILIAFDVDFDRTPRRRREITVIASSGKCYAFSSAKQPSRVARPLGCFVARAPRNDGHGAAL